LNPFIKASRGGRGFVGLGVGVKVVGWLGGVDGEGVVDGLGVVGVEAVGAVGVDTGVSEVTGAPWVEGNLTGATGLQPSSIASINNTATETPCFIIAFGPSMISHTRQPGNHIML
jgi:hypothetical protein